jgi:hypothetical protein
VLQELERWAAQVPGRVLEELQVLVILEPRE